MPGRMCAAALMAILLSAVPAGAAGEVIGGCDVAVTDVAGSQECRVSATDWRPALLGG